MWHFIQPLFAALLGIAMSIFGLLHAVRLWPAPGVWNQVALAAPQLLKVMLVLACAALAVAGLAMLVAAIRAARLRLAQLRRLRLAHEADRLGESPEHWS